MNIIKIEKKGLPLFVREVEVKELVPQKCPVKFLMRDFEEDYKVYVKCLENGEFDLRGKKNEYRIILPEMLKMMQDED